MERNENYSTVLVVKQNSKLNIEPVQNQSEKGDTKKAKLNT